MYKTLSKLHLGFLELLNLNFLNRKQDLDCQDRSGNEDSGDMSEEEEEEEVGDDCWPIF